MRVPKAFPCTDDELFLDGVDAVRTYLRVPRGMASMNLVTLHFSKLCAVADKNFVGMAATLAVIHSDDFKISATPQGALYVSTGCESDAKMLDGQKFAGFGVEITFHRVTDIDAEACHAVDDSAAFKLFDRI